MAGPPLTGAERLQVRIDLGPAFAAGIRSCAVVLKHSALYPDHELAVGRVAREMGFTQARLRDPAPPRPPASSRHPA